jgi:predicted component of type VI protein secretion system
MEMAYDDAFRYDWTRSGLNLLGNTTQQYEDHMFPLSVIGRGGWELPNWVQGYEAYWRDKAAAAQESGDGSDAETALRCADDAKAFGDHLRGSLSSTRSPTSNSTANSR